MLYGTHQLGVKADNVNILVGSVHTLYKEKQRSCISREGERKAEGV